MNTPQLTQRDSDILACLELSADTPLEKVARKLRMQIHTVQYAVRQMRERECFMPSLCVDIHALDRRYCGVFISVRGSARARAHFMQHLSSHPQVGWFAELAGSYEFGIAFAVRTPHEAEQLLVEAVRKSGVETLKKAITFRLRLTDTPRGYLASRATPGKAIDMVDGAAMTEIDARDYKILSTIDENPWSSHRALAQQLGIPHTTFELRLKKLRESGVVLGRTLQISRAATGRELHKLLIFARGRPIDLSAKLRQWAIDHPLVSHYVEALGAWDYEINVETLTARELATVIQNLHAHFGSAIDEITSLTVVQVHRFSRFPVCERVVEG